MEPSGFESVRGLPGSAFNCKPQRVDSMEGIGTHPAPMASSRRAPGVLKPVSRRNPAVGGFDAHAAPSGERLRNRGRFVMV
jgi:hypothetical protein